MHDSTYNCVLSVDHRQQHRLLYPGGCPGAEAARTQRPRLGWAIVLLWMWMAWFRPASSKAREPNPPRTLPARDPAKSKVVQRKLVFLETLYREFALQCRDDIVR